MRPAAARVQSLLRAAGLEAEVVEFAETTRTSAEAAAQIGCAVAQIAKSLVFRAKATGRPVLVIASGANRVDEKAVEALLGEKIGKADADFVRDKTGYAIGGVAPVGHATPPVTFIDESLLAFEVIWAAAGTPFAVFPLAPAELQRLTGGRVAAIARG
ncbi:MAG TPA: YbaK/EbsC family protein [Dongiaceae bacterium]|nr:YbaK/EbsC family protein [Dongiaceae bacterium]